MARLTLVLSDIDGTINDESLPEAERLETIDPARRALAELRAAGACVGLITGRSLGETAHYAELLGIEGPLVCEDGAVLALPLAAGHVLPATLAVHDLPERAYGKYRVLHLSGVPMSAIREAIEEVGVALGQTLVSSCGSSAEEIRHAVGHPSVEAAARSADRWGSAFVVTPSTAAVAALDEAARRRGLRTFGALLHLVGADVDKGRALDLLFAHAALLSEQPIAGVLPIAFGNNTNDLQALRRASALGGIGVLVARPDGGYAVDPQQLPADVVCTRAACGEGMLEALATIFARLGQRV